VRIPAAASAFEQLRAAWAATMPADPVQQIDTSALPVRHPSRVHGPDGRARRRRQAADRRRPGHWPRRRHRRAAAGNGSTGSRFAAEMAEAGIEVIIPPTRAQRQTMPKTPQRLMARLRNRVEASFTEITDQMELARHGAHTFEGLLTRPAATSPPTPSCS
jgi:hypothetical protein